MFKFGIAFLLGAVVGAGAMYFFDNDYIEGIELDLENEKRKSKEAFEQVNARHPPRGTP